jgi:hypothetical protein
MSRCGYEEVRISGYQEKKLMAETFYDSNQKGFYPFGGTWCRLRVNLDQSSKS